MKYAFITGGTKGIGRAFSEKLLSQNYYVVANYHTDDRAADEFYAAMQKIHGDNLCLLKHDLSNIAQVHELISKLLNISRKYDALIFNAGMTDRSAFPNIAVADWQNVFVMNVHVPVFVIQELFPYLNDKSNILFTGSIMGIYPHSVSLSYGVSKASVHALVKNLVKFLVPKKIRVNAIVPGFVDTDWQKEKPAEIRTSIEHKIASGHFGDPADVAQMLWSIIENEYMNGQCIVVDGGYCYR